MCTHDLAEKETACADGFCPFCMSIELNETRARVELLEGLLKEAYDDMDICVEDINHEDIMNKIRAAALPE